MLKNVVDLQKAIRDQCGKLVYDLDIYQIEAKKLVSVVSKTRAEFKHASMCSQECQPTLWLTVQVCTEWTV